MTHLTPLPTAPRLDSDHDVRGFVHDLVGPAIRQQLWLLFLDDERRPLPMLIPIEGAPMTAPRDEAERLAPGIVGVCTATGAASLVLVWERPGDAAPSALECRWFADVAAVVTAQGVEITAQALSHDDGVAVLHLA